jgi:radical SAM/Cys-rich protein
MSMAIVENDPAPVSFSDAVARVNPRALRAANAGTLMLNVGLRCDLACAHCHQSSSPRRTESMPRAIMLDALRLAEILQPALVDVTGGEPALWEHLPELVVLARSAGRQLRVRTNLVALEHPEATALPQLFARERVSLLASLPGVTAAEVAEQRGPVFEASLRVLRHLAELGYANGGDSGLKLDLAVNPPLDAMPRPELEVAEEFRATLSAIGVRFDSLRVISNVPAGRYARRLQARGEYGAYVSELAAKFNPAVLDALACRHSLEVAWDGSLADCDFNLGAGLPVADEPRTLAEALDLAAGGGDLSEMLSARRIAFGPHCFACTVGAGSS